MIKQILAILIPIILFTPYAAFAQSDTSKIALNLDKKVYSVGMNVTVAGQVLGSFNPSNPVTLNVKASNGNVYHSTSIKLDNSGTFTHQFTLNDNTALGMSTLEVAHENAHGRINGMITFEVMNRASITVQTDADNYELGENVVLEGSVSPILPEGQILVQVFNPKNSAWTFDSIPTSMISTTGRFSIDLGKLDGNLSLPGIYRVKVTYAASTATAIFTVLSDSQQTTADTPSKVKVEEDESVTMAAVAQDTYLQTEIKNEEQEEQDFTYIVLIKDSEGLTISLSWVKGTLAPNEAITMEQSWKPETSGVYSVEIFVWKSLEDPVALSPVVVKHIVVE